MYDLISRYETTINSEAEHFEEVLESIRFMYNCRHLSEAGLFRKEDINDAVGRAMLVCQLNGIDSRHHFKTVYVFNQADCSVTTDWCMTRQGLSLVIMNAPTPNLAIAKWQWQIANMMDVKM